MTADKRLQDDRVRSAVKADWLNKLAPHDPNPTYSTLDAADGLIVIPPTPYDKVSTPVRAVHAVHAEQSGVPALSSDWRQIWANTVIVVSGCVIVGLLTVIVWGIVQVTS